MKRYLVMAVRPGMVHRHDCSLAGAVVAARVYRRWGWAVTVLPRVGRDPS